MIVDLMLIREKVGYHDENWNESKYSGVSCGKQVDIDMLSSFKLEVRTVEFVPQSDCRIKHTQIPRLNDDLFHL
jgi:hypothetical protein